MVRTVTRWGLPTIGLGALACVGGCALPLLAAGSMLRGGLALIRDSCLAPLAILLLGVAAATLVVWVRRRRRAGACGDAADCGCGPRVEAEMVLPNVFRP